MKKIAVVGSSNIDMVAKVSHLPACGETVGNAEFSQCVGGKGMNQAIAAARLGGDVTFVTSLGRDSYAMELRRQLESEGIGTDYIIDTADRPTGTALIYVAGSGENCIAVAPGANYALEPELIDRFERAIAEADTVVMQAEIPYDTIKHTALRAHALGKRLILNVAPACHMEAEVLETVDTLIVNEVEAGYVSGIAYDGTNLAAIGRRLLAYGVRNVVITLGSRGAYLYNGIAETLVPSFKVDPVDTVGAGDTFCAAIAVHTAGDYITAEDLRFANAAGAIAVTRRGATPSIPTRAEVDAFLSQHNYSIPQPQDHEKTETTLCR